MKSVKALFLAGLLGPAFAATCAETKPVAPAAAPAETGGWTGTVVETTNASSYTYVRVDTGKEKIWAAAPRFEVKVGDKVTVPEGTVMRDFVSKSLNRTFDTIYFVGAIQGPGSPAQPAAAPAGDPHGGAMGGPRTAPAAPLDFAGLKKAEGGLTVAEIYAKKQSLKGKTVKVRGKVAKYNAEIMGRNWVHLQDGSGTVGSDDLTITTSDTAKVGETVLVSGTLALDKDFGYSYKYPVMLENAKVTVESPGKP
jgi:hypothetical protein